MPSHKLLDVVVIGGGPAGMMAAGRAGKLGRSVLLLEKNSTLGKKLLLTGGGRCNLTNRKSTTQVLLAKYKNSSKFLFSAFAQFGVGETIKLFNRLGVEIKEEEEGRIFPVSDSAKSVLGALIRYMREGKVEIGTNMVVDDIFVDEDTKMFHVKLKDGEEVVAKSCVIATGGISRPETGSTGDGFSWLKKMGHKIIDNDLALVPVALSDTWIKKISGVALDDIKLTTFQNEEKQKSQKGKILFTHFGISGPTILNMSKEIGELLQSGEVVIMLDLFPKIDHGELKKMLQEILISESNKKLKNVLDKLLPASLVAVILEIAGINGETINRDVSHDDRMKIVTLVKAIPLHAKGLLGANKAIISSGGVELGEVNFKTMESRLVPNLFIVGDALNIDRPSGGYSLQLCWTTGYVAGSNVR
jgi:hypothetical protein